MYFKERNKTELRKTMIQYFLRLKFEKMIFYFVIFSRTNMKK